MRLGLPLLLALTLAPPVAGQSIVIPEACPAGCAADAIALDSVSAWASVRGGAARAFVRHVVRSRGEAAGSLYFSIPPGATVANVSVFDRTQLIAYHPEIDTAAARRRWTAVPRGGRRLAGAAFGRHGLAHVPIPAMAAGARLVVQVDYSQPVGIAGDGTLRFTYPVTAAPPPEGRFSFGMEVRTEHGFRDLPTASHDMTSAWGTEPGPCPPQARCGTMSVPSVRSRILRLAGTAPVTRDIRVVYTPAAPGEDRHESTGMESDPE